MYSITTDIDSFEIALNFLIEDSIQGAKRNASKVISRATREGAKITREKAASGVGVHPWSDRYTQGFSGTVIRTGDYTVGEIGNKNEPGLVHLLEKGHATLNGRKTRAFPHVALAYNEIAENLYDEVGDAVEAGLRG